VGKYYLGEKGRGAYSPGENYTMSSLQSLEYFWFMNDINIGHPAEMKAGGWR
jgi:hypothetical protein